MLYDGMFQIVVQSQGVSFSSTCLFLSNSVHIFLSLLIICWQGDPNTIWSSWITLQPWECWGGFCFTLVEVYQIGLGAICFTKVVFGCFQIHWCRFSGSHKFSHFKLMHIWSFVYAFWQLPAQYGLCLMQGSQLIRELLFPHCFGISS